MAIAVRDTPAHVDLPPGSLDLWNFDDAIVPDDGDAVTVDLSETTFVDAYGLVGSPVRSFRPRITGRRSHSWRQGALPPDPVAMGGEKQASMPTLNAPKLVSSRDQARELTATLPPNLGEAAVVVDCSALQASTPSFVDELVKVCLVERRAKSLVLVNAPERTAELARRASRNRNVADRLEIDPPLRAT